MNVDVDSSSESNLRYRESDEGMKLKGSFLIVLCGSKKLRKVKPDQVGRREERKLIEGKFAGKLIA